jgi:CRP-like cAMP-binding protein
LADLRGESWIVKLKMQDEEAFDIYITAMYYMLATIFTIGYGDVTPEKNSEKIFVLFMCLIGVFVYSFAVSWLGNRLYQFDKKTTRLNKKLGILEEISREFKISRSLAKSIKKYFQTQFDKDLIGRANFIQTLPINLKNQLIYLMSQHHIQKHKFFLNVDYEFIIFVFPMLNSLKFEKNDLLFSIGSFVEEMYMVNSGALSLRLGKLYHSIEVAQIYEKQHFGEILMYSNEVSNFDLKVRSHICEVYMIKKNDFSKIKMRFPEMMLEKLKLSYKSYRNILLRRKFFIELISNLPNNTDKSEIKNYLKKAHKILNLRSDGS